MLVWLAKPATVNVNLTVHEASVKLAVLLSVNYIFESCFGIITVEVGSLHTP